MNINTGDLSDLLRFENGQPVRSAADWPRRRQELLDLILQFEYGQMPPAAATAGELLYSYPVDRYANAGHEQYRLSIGGDPGVRFTLNIFIPTGPPPFPVVINGDACWQYINDDIIRDVLGCGMIFAQFNRVEIVPDVPGRGRDSVIHRLYPTLDFGAIAAWAWGYHRCVDFLTTLKYVDAKKIAIFGHSRGGKTSLLAGATDPRIALTASNCSGCGGAGCFRHQGNGSEALKDILSNYHYWFTPRLRQFIGRESALPFDQHALKALVAPRALLTNEALDDLWANPSGTWTTHAAAQHAWHLLGDEEKIGIHFRRGPHDFSREDWNVFLDFADWHFQGKKPSRRFDVNPFWRAS